VSTAVAIVLAAVVLACALPMLWRMGQGRRAYCPPAGSGTTAMLRERQRELGARIESLARSDACPDTSPDRH
jgi:hypothetical protein